MNVKIETKEKFSVITPLESEFTANMTEELVQLLLTYLQKDIPHLVVNLQAIASLPASEAETLADVQQQFYEQDCSLVYCHLQPAVEKLLDEQEILEVMNITPTESEAWDIVQMEEIERELLGGED